MKVRNPYNFLMWLAFLILIGCGTTQTKTKKDFLQVKREQLLAYGNSPDFVDGYIHGCSSGKSLIDDKRYVAEKDAFRYSQSREYSIGWERGYYECRDTSIKKMQHKVRQEYVPADTTGEELERMKIWEELKK